MVLLLWVHPTVEPMIWTYPSYAQNDQLAEDGTVSVRHICAICMLALPNPKCTATFQEKRPTPITDVAGLIVLVNSRLHTPLELFL